MSWSIKLNPTPTNVNQGDLIRERIQWIVVRTGKKYYKLKIKPGKLLVVGIIMKIMNDCISLLLESLLVQILLNDLIVDFH